MMIRAHDAYSLGCCVDGIADVLAADTAVGGQILDKEGVSVNGTCVCVCVCVCVHVPVRVGVCQKLMSVKF